MLKSLRVHFLWQLSNKRVYLVAGLLACVCQSSLATVSLDTAWSLNTRSLTMRVGAGVGVTGNPVTTVKFDVNNANVSPAPLPVTGVPDIQGSGVTQANAVRISVSNNSSQNYSNNIRVTADSSTGMICVPGTGCGSTVVPFSTVSWTSYNVQTGANAGQDFVSGSFTGSGSQLLIDFNPPNYCSGVVFLGFCFGQLRPYSAAITNDQVFIYNNSTLYPAGQYKGTVTYTATLP